MQLQQIASKEDGRQADLEIIRLLHVSTGAVSAALVKTYREDPVDVSSGRVPLALKHRVFEVCEHARKCSESQVIDLPEQQIRIVGIPLLPEAGFTAVVLLMPMDVELETELFEKATLAASYLRLSFEKRRDNSEMYNEEISDLVDIADLVQKHDSFRTACEEAVRRLRTRMNCRFVALCEPIGRCISVTAVAGLSQPERDSSMFRMLSEVAEETLENEDMSTFATTARLRNSRLPYHSAFCNAMRCGYVGSQPITSGDQLVAILIWAGDEEGTLRETSRFAYGFSRTSGRMLQLISANDRFRWIDAARKISQLMCKKLHLFPGGR